jgi:hypothetical protein
VRSLRQYRACSLRNNKSLEQRSSGSPPRGPAYRSGIDERSAAGVAPDAAVAG